MIQKCSHRKKCIVEEITVDHQVCTLQLYAFFNVCAWNNTFIVHYISITDKNYREGKRSRECHSWETNSSWKSHSTAVVPEHLDNCFTLHGAISKQLSMLEIAASILHFAEQIHCQGLLKFTQEPYNSEWSNEVTTEPGPFWLNGFFLHVFDFDKKLLLTDVNCY